MTSLAELHELSCSGPTDDGCACRPSKDKLRLLEMHRVAPDWQVIDYVTNSAIDTYLDSLESLLLTIGQRQLRQDQLDRFARLLQGAEQAAVMQAKRR